MYFLLKHPLNTEQYQNLFEIGNKFLAVDIEDERKSLSRGNIALSDGKIVFDILTSTRKSIRIKDLNKNQIKLSSNSNYSTSCDRLLPLPLI